MKISTVDFEYLTRYSDEMDAYHQENFLARIEPERIQKYYESEKLVSDYEAANLEADEQDVNRICMNKFFPATQTLLAVLYPAKPKFICSEKRGEQDQYKALVAGAGMNYYFEEMGANEENKSAILNAWFFGFGCIKQGWKQTFGYIPKEEQTDILNPLVDKAKRLFVKDIEIEQDEVIIEDGPFLESISPMDLKLDHKRPFNKGRFIEQSIDTTLDRIIKSPLYKNMPDRQAFIDSFRNRTDDRQIDITLRELWIRDNKNDIYLLTHIKEWKNPLRWVKIGTYSEGFPYQLLRLQRQPSKMTYKDPSVYPMSHFKVGMKAQREIDYILTLWLNNVKKLRSQTYVNEKLFTDVKQAKGVLEDNEQGGIVYGGRPATAGDIMPITSAPLQKEVFNLLDVLQINLQEILTVTGARASGESKNPTLGQEQITESGNQMRTMGMQESINEFLVLQGRKLLQDLKQFATAPVLLKITGLNKRDPMTGQMMTETWGDFSSMGEGDLKDAIQGEFDIDVDISQTQRKDVVVIRQQLMQVLALIGRPDLQQALQAEGKRLRISDLITDILKTFDALANSDKYVEELPQGGMNLPFMPGGAGMPDINIPGGMAGQGLPVQGAM